MSKIAVTGGSGFIGSNLVDRLVEEGHEVLVIDEVPAIRGDVEYHSVDIRDGLHIATATRGCDTVFHLAAVSNVDHAFQDPVKTVALNILGLANVLEAARQNSISHVLFASTVWVYSGTREEGRPLEEDVPFHLPDAGHVYTTSKIAGEMLVHDYSALYGQHGTILRYGIPYGPRMRRQLVIPIFVDKALKKQTIVIQGDGSQHRNYVYIDDLVDAHVRALQSIPEGVEVFNLEGRERVTIRNIVEAIESALDREVAVEYVAARKGDYKGGQISAEKAEAELGWKPTVDFELGMRRYIDWHMDAWPPGSE